MLNPYQTAHLKEPFPHGVSCDICRELGVCNSCKGSADKNMRCTNGRCPACCAKKCKHVTE